MIIELGADEETDDCTQMDVKNCHILMVCNQGV